ncbi:MAG: response regulator [Planctomycetes bacterium]|nr:response regulator [Planctomycetota bacterium]
MSRQRDHLAEQASALHAAVSREIRANHHAFHRLCSLGLAALAAVSILVAVCWLAIFALLPLVAAFGVILTRSARRVSESLVQQIGMLEQVRDTAVTNAGVQAQFLANMSHEIRTPMNGILGMAELLVRTRLDAEQEQMATTIQASADSLLNVLNDILDYSKIEAGRLELEAADFDLWQMIDDCAGLLHSSANQKGVELMTFLDPRISRSFRGDQSRIRQVVLNFLTNAIKFTMEGEVVLSVDLVEEDDSSQLLSLSVKDTGVGISRDGIRRLFKPFAQADASTTRRFGGTGLGLTISRRLALMMGGKITVESVIDQGSTFTFHVRLPLGDTTHARARPGEVDLSGHAILIVDDNETNRQLMVMQLTPTQIGIDVASNAISAIEVLRSASLRGNPFTMAVLDMAMPGFDGMQLAEAIRNDPDIPRIPIALASSLGTRPGLAEMAAADVFRWLNKPLSCGRLLQLVHDMASLRGAVSTQQPMRPNSEPEALAMEAAAALRVLVAEDNEINRRVLAGMMSRIGCEVTFATDGNEAVEMVKANEFDLVLMDCQMPEMDGFEATRAIRALGGHLAELPIVALTANVMPADREACVEAGMNDFLAKPVKLDVLRAAVQRWGDGSRRRLAPVAATPAAPPDQSE